MSLKITFCNYFYGTYWFSSGFDWCFIQHVGLALAFSIDWVGLGRRVGRWGGHWTKNILESKFEKDQEGLREDSD